MSTAKSLLKAKVIIQVVNGGLEKWLVQKESRQIFEFLVAGI
jgi:hypothetical protein